LGTEKRRQNGRGQNQSFHLYTFSLSKLDRLGDARIRPNSEKTPRCVALHFS
jgi:hypothetical protein